MNTRINKKSKDALYKLCTLEIVVHFCCQTRNGTHIFYIMILLKTWKESALYIFYFLGQITIT